MSNGRPLAATALRVLAAQRGERASGVEQSGVEEVRADASGLERELAEAKDAELETLIDE